MTGLTILCLLRGRCGTEARIFAVVSAIGQCAPIPLPLAGRGPAPRLSGGRGFGTKPREVGYTRRNKVADDGFGIVCL